MPVGPQPLHQALYLDVVNLGAPLVTISLTCGYIREPRYLPSQWYVHPRHDQGNRNPAQGSYAVRVITRSVCEAGHPHPVLRKPLQIDVRGYQLGACAEPGALRDQLAVLTYKSVAIPGQVRGRLAGARRGVQVACDAPSGLRLTQQSAVRGITHDDVARRQVHQQRGAS